MENDLIERCVPRMAKMAYSLVIIFVQPELVVSSSNIYTGLEDQAISLCNYGAKSSKPWFST